MKTIRQLRQDQRWTRYELAVKVGVHPQAVYLWESGRRTPQVPQLRMLGQLFGRCSDDIELEHVPAADTRGTPSRPSIRTERKDALRRNSSHRSNHRVSF